MLDGQINPREWYNWHSREFQPHYYDLHKFLYEASAIGQFCNDILFAPSAEVIAVLPIAYGTFALIVAITWVFAPPRLPARRSRPPLPAPENVS